MTEDTWSGPAMTVLGFVGLRGPDRAISGYDIKQLAERSVQRFFSLSFGQIYPLLAKLEGGGLVEQLPDPDSNRDRKTYRITAAGQAELRTWLDRDAEPIASRDLDLARMLLVGHLDPARTLDLVQARRTHLESELAKVRAVVGLPDLPPGVRTLIVDSVVDFGVATLTAQIEWCHRTEQQLKRALSARL
ncbi:PadR family transcriptional regulator [Antrihabitans cavernicola]|uniref:PadR family transcriptional regulator n=1 Tax=Antrihabitans cavernicola TaxID=2495913 RepID=A0A5A7SJU2_9NOCA|nr:PadR family transcriptional regulator [Spelaeibacter cavernicola]KAA0024461.1 PadR family transcriptional regulator [Spelaeibacter cavernicola]